jgi:metal-responsive CopG/Arc/MetJ family transcriptional regulator
MIKYDIRFLVQLNQDLNNKLEKKAKEEETNRSTIIRQLIKKHL